MRIAELGVAIAGAILSVGCGILLVRRIERIVQQRFQRLVVRWQRAILQSARDIQPSHAVRMENEWSVARKSAHTGRARLRLIVGRFFLIEVGLVVAGPFLLLLVPPNQLLSFAPRRSVGTCGGAVIKDANVGWP